MPSSAGVIGGLRTRNSKKPSTTTIPRSSCDPTHILALLNRSQAFQHLGLHKEAIRDWKKLVELGRSAPDHQRAVLLNGLAYAQALGNVELKEALENIIQAINLAGENAAMLDTRGYIHFCAR